MTIDLIKHQDEFLYSNHRYTGLITGYGGGKTFSAIIKTISKKLQYPNINVAYYLPTYPLIKSIAFPRFSEILDKLNIPYSFNLTDKNINTPFGKIIFRSMEKPETIVGYEVGYSLIDEADTIKKDKMIDVFGKIVARNRTKLPNGDQNCVDMVSTPEGFNFLYYFFVENKSEEKRIIKGKTTDNPFLPTDYIDSLKENYSEEKLKAYINGEFVNMESFPVYYSFNRELHDTKKELNENSILHIGVDFNVTNMSAVIHIIEDKIIYAIDEITGAFDTQDLCDAIRERYSNRNIILYPDASSQNRNTSGHSDIDILKKNKFRVKVPKKNPPIKDRVNAINTNFLNSKGETKYFINTKKCTEYTKALEQLVYKNGLPDKTSGLDHITDAGGYFITGLNGVFRKPKTKKAVLL